MIYFASQIEWNPGFLKYLREVGIGLRSLVMKEIWSLLSVGPRNYNFTLPVKGNHLCFIEQPKSLVTCHTLKY